MTYILVDTANTFFRARHVINGDADIKLGMAFHITLNSIKKAVSYTHLTLPTKRIV